MRPHTPHHGRHWDGSLRHLPYRRTLRIAADSPSRLLRAGQTGHCRQCGNRIDRYECLDGRLIDLHPAEVVTTDISVICRWHVSSGIAHPHDDGSGWCRIAHAVLCPQQPAHCQTDSRRLESLRRELGLRTRRLIDTGAFTPQAHTPNTEAPGARSCQHPTRPT